MDKKTVLLVLCRKVIAGLLVEAIESRTGLEPVGIYEFKQAKNTALLQKPKIALIEIPERHGAPAQETLVVCEEIKAASPGCKIILVCPENDQASVKACQDAVKSGKIQDFMFYDISVDYLVAKLEALLP